MRDRWSGWHDPYGPPEPARRRAEPVRDPARERAIARARKLQALADHPGTKAEGTAARAALRRHVKTHGLSMREL